MADDGIAELGEANSNEADNLKIPEKHPLLKSLKERLINSSPSQAATNIDILGRLRNLASDPRTYNLMAKGIEAGILAGVITGMFGDSSNQPILMDAFFISKALAGMPDINPNISPQLKLATETLNMLGFPSIVEYLTDALEILPDLNLGEKGVAVKEHAFAIANRAREVFGGIKNRLSLEEKDFQANSLEILNAMQTFGVASPNLEDVVTV